jgi:hypothetical protein
MGDHVVTAGAERDAALLVSHGAVVAYPKAVASLHEESIDAVVREEVSPDQGVGGLNGEDSTAVAPEGAVEDPIVMRLEQMIEHLLADLGLPATPAMRRVLAAHLKDRTDAEAIEQARQEIRDHYESQFEREFEREQEREERRALPAGEPDPDEEEGELVTGKVVDEPAGEPVGASASAPEPPDSRPSRTAVAAEETFADLLPPDQAAGPLFADPSAGDSWVPGTVPSSAERASWRTIERP